MSVTFTTELTDVSIYPYHPLNPIEVPPVLTGGSGTYVVGVFLNSVGYNLGVKDGKQARPLEINQPYFAIGKDKATGKVVHTHFMFCTNASEAPNFQFVQTTPLPQSSQTR